MTEFKIRGQLKSQNESRTHRNYIVLIKTLIRMDSFNNGKIGQIQNPNLDGLQKNQQIFQIKFKNLIWMGYRKLSRFSETNSKP